MNDPINKIEWIDAHELEANDYNPNIVYTPELKALEKNIIEIGWVQPVIIDMAGVIIDGFHRVMLSRQSKPLLKKYKGKVPCVIFDVPGDEAMIITVRMNRAKGSHIAVRMSQMVKQLIDEHGWEVERIAKQIGAPKAEIDVLYQDSVFKMRNIKKYKYSKAWYPVEVEDD